MIKQISNDKGFTLVEFMVAILITGIIAGTIASYLVSHFNSFETASSKTNIQYEAQVVLGNFTRLAINTSGIHEIKDTGGFSKLNSTSSLEPWLLVLIEEKPGGDEYHVFTIDSSDDNLYYYKTTNTVEFSPSSLSAGDHLGSLFSKNVDTLTVEPRSQDGTALKFVDSESIEMTLEISSGTLDSEARTMVNFRNKN